ncbi:eclosion hormone [Danaus plexippus]|uniref:eclosion hormone n=1 Tax=Danaus plexippus TaxID=13037 RepID=UPI002AB07CA1|nr:eclosion hormone [Danaus plexippus]
MVGKIAYTLLAIGILQYCLIPVDTNPAIATSYEPLEICMENCALCRKMLGTWFNGQLCGESCYKYRGKLIPECEDFASISPFLNKL